MKKEKAIVIDPIGELDVFYLQNASGGYSLSLAEDDDAELMILPKANGEIEQRNIGKLKQRIAHYMNMIDYLTLGFEKAILRLSIDKTMSSPDGKFLFANTSPEVIGDMMLKLRLKLSGLQSDLEAQTASLLATGVGGGLLIDGVTVMTPPGLETALGALSSVIMSVRNARTLSGICAMKKMANWCQSGMFNSWDMIEEDGEISNEGKRILEIRDILDNDGLLNRVARVVQGLKAA